MIFEAVKLIKRKWLSVHLKFFGFKAPMKNVIEHKIYEKRHLFSSPTIIIRVRKIFMITLRDYNKICCMYVSRILKFILFLCEKNEYFLIEI